MMTKELCVITECVSKDLEPVSKVSDVIKKYGGI